MHHALFRRSRLLISPPHLQVTTAAAPNIRFRSTQSTSAASSASQARIATMADPESQHVPRQGKPSKGKGNQKGRGGGGGKGKPSGSTKLRGLEKDSPEVRTSKTLSWLLRHGAASEGLAMRADGYVQVDELLRHPRLSACSLDLDGLRRIVADDAKKRYDLKFEPEISSAGASASLETEIQEQPSLNGLWWIKANQGHSMKTVQLDLKPISSLDDIPTAVAVHGTTVAAWKAIEKEGLSKMKRNHIHLAQAVSTTNAISGLRKSAQILIYINIAKAIFCGIQFSLSDNGVVLTEGDETGYLKPEFFLRVENTKHDALPGWEGLGPIITKPVDSKTAAVPSSQSNPGNSKEFSVRKDDVIPIDASTGELTVTERVESQ